MLEKNERKKVVEMVEEAAGSGGEKLFSFLTDYFAGSSPPGSARPMLGGEWTCLFPFRELYGFAVLLII
jgi:hypothetical protein